MLNKPLAYNSTMTRLPADSLHSLIDHVRFACSQMERMGISFGHGRDNAIDEAIDLVRHVCALPIDAPDSFWQAAMTPEEKQQLHHLLDQRINERIPLPYLTQQSRFAGFEFYVDERVLIPRSPIGELIETAFLPWLKTQPERILDLCTGSGCIAIACALHFADCPIIAADIDRDALAVADKNIKQFGVEQQCQLRLSNGMESIDEDFDLIICNPPYVDAQDMAALPQEYLAEPTHALASGTDGLDFIRTWLPSILKQLCNDGLLILEVGASRDALLETFPQYDWIEIELKNSNAQGIFALYKDEKTDYSILLDE